MKAITLSVLAMLALAARGENSGDYRVSGPYTYENLSVFLIHGQSRAAGKLLTLQEAIAQHKVVVYETRNVNGLTIENVSDQDVFIESGDIVKGGAQDRTLKDDVILPTRSGKINISAFCVEHGRWSRRGEESVTTFNSAAETVATKEMKMAVRVEADQTQVWNKVAKAQNQLSNATGVSARAAESPSSFVMTMSAQVVQKSIDGYLKRLSGIIDGHNDVIGFAFAINGKVNSADVYASHDLFSRLWPKLLRASAVEAVSEYEKARKFESASADAVRAALRDADSGRASSKDTTARTEVVTRQTGQNIMFETRDHSERDAWVHRSYLTK